MRILLKRKILNKIQKNKGKIITYYFLYQINFQFFITIINLSLVYEKIKFNKTLIIPYYFFLTNLNCTIFSLFR